MGSAILASKGKREVGVEIDQDRIQSLVDQPGESLSVELKNWISPEEPHGQAKIVRAALAMRNHDGGFLVIGFDDKSLTQDREHAPQNVREVYHPDKVQSLVSNFASESFEVGVAYATRDGIEHPVLVMPSGVRTPCVSKSSLSVGGNSVIAQGDVFVRTLRSSNVPATSKINWKDWPDLVERCFNNREADIGRFVRRHLSGEGLLALRELLGGNAISSPPPPDPSSESTALLDATPARMQALASRQHKSLPDAGWWDAAFTIEGVVPLQPSGKDFLRLLESSNPRLSGWPMWLISDRFSDGSSHPIRVDGVWEALIVASGLVQHFQYMRYEPTGRFAHRSALVDDTANIDGRPEPRSVFDFAFPIQDCAESIAVGLAFAKAMGCESTSTTLHFAFRWSGLLGRELSSWAHRNRYISSGQKAFEDVVTVEVRVPMDTPPQAIGALLTEPLQDLYRIFDGFQLSAAVVEEIATRVVTRDTIR